MATTDQDTDSYEGEGRSVADYLRDEACQVTDRVNSQLDALADYARNDPIKAVVLSAAAGALLFVAAGGASRCMRRSSSSNWVPSKDTLQAFADQASKKAQDAADSGGGLLASARQAAQQAYDDATKQLHSLAGEASKQLQSFGKTAAEEAADTKESAFAAAKRLAEQAYDDASKRLQALSKKASEQAADTRDTALARARSVAGQAYDGVSDRLQDLRKKADPLVDQLQPHVETVTNYAKSDPVKALLIALAAGALLSRLTK